MYSEEIERAVLFYIIFEKEEFILNEKDFVDTKNKKIINAINQLKLAKKEISILSIADEVKMDRTEILKYLSNLAEYIYGMSAQVAYSKLIEYSKTRQVYELILNTGRRIAKGEDEEEIDNLIEKIIKQLEEIGRRNKKTNTFQELVIDTMKEIENNYNCRTDYSLYTGLIELDKKILGLHKKEFTVIGARPGIGKTSLALQIAEHIARNGCHVGFVSLEMSETQLIQKIIARISEVNSYKLRSGMLEDDDFLKIGKVCGDLSGLPFHIISKTTTIQEIEVAARQLKNKGELDLLIVDYLQLIRNLKKYNNREQEVANISRTLKLLSIELEIPIIALCQLNRNATKNEPALADLRESGAIEQDADNVIFLYSEEGQEEAVAPIIIAKIAKQRAGDIGKIKLQFNKVNSKFLSMVKW